MTENKEIKRQAEAIKAKSKPFLRLLFIKQKVDGTWVLKLEYYGKIFELALDEFEVDGKWMIPLSAEGEEGELGIQLCNDLKSEEYMSFIRIKEVIADMSDWDNIPMSGDDDGK